MRFWLLGANFLFETSKGRGHPVQSHTVNVGESSGLGLTIASTSLSCVFPNSFYSDCSIEHENIPNEILLQQSHCLN